MLVSSELERGKIPVRVLRLTAIYGAGDTHNAYVSFPELLRFMTM